MNIWNVISESPTSFIMGIATGTMTILGFCLAKTYFGQNTKVKDLNVVKEKEMVLNKGQFDDLSKNGVYKRLASECRPKNNFYCQYVSDPFIPSVIAINFLIEWIPSSIVKIVFLYLPKVKDFDIDNHLSLGWEERKDVLHDNPNIFVQNVKGIRNQPSLILTIGLPGSGKTTWSHTRVGKAGAITAADDYFDKFNKGNFDVSLLGKAHEWAQNKIFGALAAGQTVVANNTNTTLSEMHAYVNKVVFSGYPHKIVFAVMPERNTKTLSKRGLHGVPAKKIKEMNRRMSRWMDRCNPSITKVIRAGAFKRSFNKKDVSKEVIYTGLFFNAHTREKVRKYMIGMSGQPLLSDLKGDHVTLKYMPTVKEVNTLPFGKKVFIKIVGYAVSDYVQCFIVDILDEDIRRLCANKYPHITISFNKSKCGPVASNDLLLNGCVIPTINNCDFKKTPNYDELYRDPKHANGGGLIIEGVIGAFFKDPNGGIRLKSNEQIEQESLKKKNSKQRKRKRQRKNKRNKADAQVSK